MKVLIDDMRSPEGMDLILRTYDSAMWFFQKQVDMSEDVLYMDNDLGSKDPYLDGDKLLSTLFTANIWSMMPKAFFIMTDNPVARQRMINLFRANGYILDVKSQLWIKGPTPWGKPLKSTIKC